jgi:hypothetical protein
MPASDMPEPNFTERNARAYADFFEIENGLRELLIEKLDEKFKNTWLKQNVPGDVRENMKKGKEYERALPWLKIASFHPIYYADFPDLKKIILNGNNWKEVFEKYFKSKQRIDIMLSELEPVRNKIAHCRAVTDSDISTIKKFHSEIGSHFGRPICKIMQERMIKYASVTAALRDLERRLTQAAFEIKNAGSLGRVDG